LKAAEMKELRVYINTAGTLWQDEERAFYSRRSDGPYYRWRYEEAQGRWCFSRVRLSRFVLKALCAANWKAVPDALRKTLDEHYLE
jgi:hypothetical protein